jgi:hypothetical protein
MVVGAGVGLAVGKATAYTIETTERTNKRIRNRRRAKLITTINAVIDRQVELASWCVQPQPPLKAGRLSCRHPARTEELP